MSDSTEPSLSRNASFRFLGFLGSLGLTFVTTPILLRELGSEQFGLWIIATGLLGASAVTEWGLGTAVAYRLAPARKRGQQEQINDLVGAALFLFVGVGLVAAGGLALVLNPIISRVLEDPDAQRMAQSGFSWLPLAVPFLLLRNFFASVAIAYERYDLSTSMFFGSSVVGVGGATGLSMVGFDLSALIFWQVIALVFAAGCSGSITRRLLGKEYKYRWPNALTLKVLSRYAAPVGIVGVGNRLFNTVDRVLVGMILGPAAVAYYGIAAAVSNKVLSLTQNLSQVILPRISSLEGSGETGTAAAILIKSTTAVGSIAAVAGVGLTLVGPAFLRWWMGPEYSADASRALQVLIPIYVGLAVIAPAIHFSNGSGKPGRVAGASLIGGILTAALILTVGQDGIIAASLSNAGHLVIAAIPVLILRELGQGLRGNYARALAEPAGGFVAGWLMVTIWRSSGGGHYVAAIAVSCVIIYNCIILLRLGMGGK